MLEKLNQPYILLFVSMFLCAVGRAMSNLYSKRCAANRADGVFYTFVIGIVAVPVILVFLIGDGFQGISLFTLVWSVFFGLFTFLNVFLNTRALSVGPLALTSIIISGSGIIPALYGVIFLGEQITVWQIIGIILMLVSVFFSVDKEPEKRKADLRWLLLTILCFILNGLVGVCQKVHRASPYAAEINEYLLLTFFFVVLFTGLYLLILKKKGIVKTVRLFGNAPKEEAEAAKTPEEQPVKKSLFRRVFVILLIGGLANALINIFNLYLSGAFDAALFFPVMNGGSVLTTLLLSFIIFREKFTGRRALSLVIGVIALLFFFDIIPMALRAIGVAV